MSLLVVLGLTFAAGYIAHVLVETVRRSAEMQRHIDRTRLSILRQYGDNDELGDLIRREERKIRGKHYQE